MKTIISIAALCALGLTACGGSAGSEGNSTPKPDTIETVDGRQIGSFGTGYTVSEDGMEFGYTCDPDETAWAPLDSEGAPDGMPLCLDGDMTLEEAFAN